MKKSSDQKLVHEAIEFSKVIKSDLDNHVFKQISDQNKIRCVEFVQRGLSLTEVAVIFGIPKSTLSGWKFRVESSYCDIPLKATPTQGFATKTAAPSNWISKGDPKLNKTLDENKLIEVRLAKSSAEQMTSEPQIEFTVSSVNFNLSIKNLNLLSAKELMKDYLKCLSMKEI